MKAFTTGLPRAQRAASAINANPAGQAPDSGPDADAGSSSGSGSGSDGSDRRNIQSPGSNIRRVRSPWLALGLLAVAFALGGCSFFPTYGASKGATSQGNDIFNLYSGMMTTGIIVAGIVFLLILYSIIRYRRRSDAIPKQSQDNRPLEITYTVIPILVVIGLFVFTVTTENAVDATQPASATVTSTGKPVVDVTITAFQWGWRFDYPHLNVGVAGEGTSGPNGRGPQMVLPTNETVQITLVSNDVTHAFYVRDFSFQRMALPGVTNVFDLNVVRQGTYRGQCTELCGLYHSEMVFTVKAVSPSAFRTWSRAEVAAGHTLQLGGNSASNIPPPNTHVTPSNALGPTSPPTPKGAA